MLCCHHTLRWFCYGYFFSHCCCYKIQFFFFFYIHLRSMKYIVHTLYSTFSMNFFLCTVASCRLLFARGAIFESSRFTIHRAWQIIFATISLLLKKRVLRIKKTLTVKVFNGILYGCTMLSIEWIALVV